MWRYPPPRLRKRSRLVAARHKGTGPVRPVQRKQTDEEKTSSLNTSSEPSTLCRNQTDSGEGLNTTATCPRPSVLPEGDKRGHAKAFAARICTDDAKSLALRPVDRSRIRLHGRRHCRIFHGLLDGSNRVWRLTWSGQDTLLLSLTGFLRQDKMFSITIQNSDITQATGLWAAPPDNVCHDSVQTDPRAQRSRGKPAAPRCTPVKWTGRSVSPIGPTSACGRRSAKRRSAKPDRGAAPGQRR